jgi:hypothetical protein
MKSPCRTHVFNAHAHSAAALASRPMDPGFAKRISAKAGSSAFGISGWCHLIAASGGCVRLSLTRIQSAIAASARRPASSITSFRTAVSIGCSGIRATGKVYASAVTASRLPMRHAPSQTERTNAPRRPIANFAMPGLASLKPTRPGSLLLHGVASYGRRGDGESKILNATAEMRVGSNFFACKIGMSATNPLVFNR